MRHHQTDNQQNINIWMLMVFFVVILMGGVTIYFQERMTLVFNSIEFAMSKAYLLGCAEASGINCEAKAKAYKKELEKLNEIPTN